MGAFKERIIIQIWVATLDDSDSLVFNEHCWLIPREESVIDMYFFGYEQNTWNVSVIL